MLRLCVLFIFTTSIASAQDSKKEQRKIVENLKKHIGYLSDDKLEGRRAGTEGERLASEYIAEQFRRNGIKPLDTVNTFFQPFLIDDGRKVQEGSTISIDGQKTLIFPDQFQPHSNNPTADTWKAVFNPAINEKGHAWYLDASEWSERNRNNPHFDPSQALKEEIKKMSELGATAVIISIPPKSDLETLFNGKDKSQPIPIPAFFIKEKTFKESFNDAETELTIDCRILPISRKARNVVGWIDNKATYTVVIGAHYDHLGYGEDGNSMLRGGEKSIHNGADDNASGTGALIELSRLIKMKNTGSHNYLFIAFSGEELGLYGSKHFVQNPPYPIENTSFMINLDMVGRLNDSTRTLTIGGYGTSRRWPELLSIDNTNAGFKVKIDSSGSGPSDHTSFYRKDIPVLFFFTGLHSDYHKPTDDHDKINYNGTKDIVRYIKAVVDRTRFHDKIDFQKTREQQVGTSTRFTVSMGIMPDYTYGGTGVRVDGVSEGRPAKTVGIKTGDIVIKLGEREVDSVESYMKALSGYRKGDKTRVVVKRGNETLSYDIVF